MSFMLTGGGIWSGCQGRLSLPLDFLFCFVLFLRGCPWFLLPQIRLFGRIFVRWTGRLVAYMNSLNTSQNETEGQNSWKAEIPNSHCIIVEHHLTDTPIEQGTITCFMCSITLFSEIKKYYYCTALFHHCQQCTEDEPNRNWRQVTLNVLEA